VISFLSSPATVSPVEEILLTLPCSTCSRNSGLYGIRAEGSRPGANSETLM
jgi:hypothetical protein